MAIHFSPPENAPKEDNKLSAEIDASARWPVVFFFTAGIFWIFAGAAIGMLAYFKFRNPDHLAGDPRNILGFLGVPDGTFDFIPLSWVDLAPLTTWGKLKPAFHHLLIYGWACSAALGTAIWLMARLTKTKVIAPLVLLVAGHFWHVGVLLGLIGIIWGGPSGMEWFDMPGYAQAVLFGSYIVISVPLFLMLFRKQSSGRFIATKYLVGGLFWFPWVFGTMSLLSSANVLPGVLAPVINFWYVDAFIMLWMLPIALAVFLFLVPKMTGEPLANYSYPHLAFWMFALLGGLLGARHLVHLPVPDWLVTMSIAASVLTAIPALMIAYSVIPPLGKAYGLFGQSVALRFLGFGFAAFLVFTVVGAFTSMEFIKGITQFTLASDAYFYLALYCFPSMIFVGAIYYVLPKVLGVEWHSRKLSELHYWGTLFSVTFLTVFMFAGGAAQGNVLSEPENFMATSVRQAEIITFVGQWFWVVIVITNFLFLVNLIRSILDYYNPSSAIKEAFVTPKSEGSSTGSSNNSGETKTAASTA